MDIFLFHKTVLDDENNQWRTCWIQLLHWNIFHKTTIWPVDTNYQYSSTPLFLQELPRQYTCGDWFHLQATWSNCVTSDTSQLNSLLSICASTSWLNNCTIVDPEGCFPLHQFLSLENLQQDHIGLGNLTSKCFIFLHDNRSDWCQSRPP